MVVQVRVRDVLKIALETYLSRIAQEERWLQSAMAQVGSQTGRMI